MREYANSIKQMSNIPLDVHLMVKDVKEFIDDYIGLEPNRITFHMEATSSKEETMDIINYLKENNIKAGLAIKPSTKIEEVYEFLPYIHMCLVMTVEPGLGGQKLIPETLEKVKTLKEYIDKNNIDIDIEVDGGINAETIEDAKKSGANIFVIGTAIVNAENIEEAAQNFRK